MLAAGALLLATPSCKKGENDPFLSLSSRKARFSGDWDVTAKSSTSSTTSGDWTSSSSTEFDGTTQTTTTSVTNSGTTTSSTSTRTITSDNWVIEKDGTFSRSYDYTYTEEVEDWGGFSTTTTTYTVTTTISGTWSFVGKAKGEFANKERVVFNILASDATVNESWEQRLDSDNSLIDDGTSSDADAYTYSHGEYVWAVNIDQLKGKEMIWVMESDGTASNSNTTGSTTTTTTSTTTGSETWTLTAK